MTLSKDAGAIQVLMGCFNDHRLPRMMEPYGEISHKALKNEPKL